MLTIYKYTLPVSDEFNVHMPKGARLLSVQVQHDAPCLWAMVETNNTKVQRRIAIRGTGHSAERLGFAPFVGTFQLQGGALVFHVFDLGEEG